MKLHRLGAVGEVAEHFGRHKQRDAEAIDFAAVENRSGGLGSLTLCGYCLPPMVSGASHYALQGHGVLARGIDYAASFMVVGMRLLRLQRRGANEQKSGKG